MSPAVLYQRALVALRRGHGGALALARAAAAAAPDFVPARLLEATLLAYSRDARDVEAAGWLFARLRRRPVNAHERKHVDALAAAIDGELARAAAAYDRILDAEPHDWLALWAAQVVDYYLGTPGLHARAARVIGRWSPSQPGYHAVLAMLAFGLGESGDYAAAEDAARRALDLEPLDLRAEHALLHVFEMQGRAEEGVRWMESRAGRASAPNHLWWHLALFHLQLGRTAQALAVYDGRMRLGALADLIDASALLWRLHLGGAEVGQRFAALAAHWSQYAEDAFCAFNDLHAMMAFVGAERWALAERLLFAQARRAARAAGANYDMTRLVGLPACRALAAFGRGDYARAEAMLRALPPVAHRIGGSHAQRDVLTLTRAAAAARRRLRAHRDRRPSFWGGPGVFRDRRLMCGRAPWMTIAP